MQRLPVLPILVLAAFAGIPVRADSPPPVKLAETPAARLGTAPPGLGIPVGDKAPDATLKDISGTTRKLSDLYARGPVFIVFYRGGWCPFCNLQLHALAEAKLEFDKRGVGLVAISVDQPSQEAKTQAKHRIPFPMLSDSKLLAHKAFNVVHVPGEAEQRALTGYGVDLTAYSGESHKSFAVPSIFLIDRAGIVRFAHIDQDYRTRPSIPQMLAVAGSMLGNTR
ncbi:MAG: peroxiredoxin-like family protein [Steroidobacteraceae bacterium]